MTSLAYYTLDVFTDRPFTGNPLAVFPDAGELGNDAMQAIARELNLSETVFVGAPADRNRLPVRIFTPARELPFAGHPTVGTALLLAELGRLEGDANGGFELVLEQKVGPVPVTISPAAPRRSARFRTARLPEVTPSTLDRATAAALVGLDATLVIADPVVASCGGAFQLIELADADALARAELDLARWRACLAADAAPELYYYTRAGGEADLRARMFAPAIGIFEDPATGSAAAALAGYLATLRRDDGIQSLIIGQGTEMGRPSLIQTEVIQHRGRVEAVYVSGRAVIVAEGRFRLD